MLPLSQSGQRTGCSEACQGQTGSGGGFIESRKRVRRENNLRPAMRTVKPRTMSKTGAPKRGSRVSDRLALVTGASQGVGKGIASELARDGFIVAVNYIGSE